MQDKFYITGFSGFLSFEWTHLFLPPEVKFPPRRNKYTRGNTFSSVKGDLKEKLH